MHLKGGDKRQNRKWRLEHAQKGYCPHYHRVGRVKMEVRFYPNHSRKHWRVLNLVTNVIHIFTKNGSPLSHGTRGRLIGPIIEKRKLKKCVSPAPLAAAESRC